MDWTWYFNLQKFFEAKKRRFWTLSGKVFSSAWTTSIKETVRKVLAGACVVISSLLPVTTAALMTGCSDGWGGTEEVKDTTAPTINVSKTEVDITWGKEIRISGNLLYIGNVVAASWSDETTKNCKVELSLNWKPVTSGTTLSEEWTLNVKVSDAAWNVSNAAIQLNINNAPEITVNQYEINIFWWEIISINDNQLLIGDEVVASWKDDRSKSFKVDLKFNGQPVKSWDTIDWAGTLSITVTNEKWKSSSTEITVTNDAVFGLETLRKASMKVDQEINLLNGISFAKWVELVRTEIETDGKRSTIADPSHYTPEYPWTCNIIFTVQWKNGETAEIKVENLTVKPLDYKEATINNANMIQEKYPWYNNLQQSTKNFIYPHLIASYAACNWSKQDNRVHIIMWETTDASDVENIWQWNDWDDHAYEWYHRIRALSPDVSIKWCADYWSNLEKYINQHPGKIYLISCAAGSSWWTNREEYNNNPETAPQKRLLENENIMIICSGWNWWPSWWKTYNENSKNWDYYTASATNSKKNNMITAVWYNSWWGDNYFSPRYSVYWWLRSAMPVWYDKDKWNIVMPMVWLIWSNNQEDYYTSSSYPTAVTSGVIWNAISVIMANHPWITAEDAMTIIVKNYLIQEKFQYKDETTNWELVDGDYWYFIDMQKLLKSELLQSDKIEKIQLNSDLVNLPGGPGICYTGKWIQFEYEWEKHNVTSENQSVLNQALKSGNVKWYWHKDSFKKYGWTDSANFDVYVVDKNWKKIPDAHLSITKNIS